jgi:hypothetical protein
MPCSAATPSHSVHLQAAKAFKEAVAGFTLRIQQLAALWVQLLETMDHAGMLPTQITGQTTSVPQTQVASVPVQPPGMAAALPTAAALAGPNWLPAFHTLLQESSDALKVCVPAPCTGMHVLSYSLKCWPAVSIFYLVSSREALFPR